MIRELFSVILTLLSFTSFSQNNEEKFITPMKVWNDTDGVMINAHGAGALFHDGIYYIFGEHKIEGKAGNVAHVGVRCYSSKNLYNWTNEGVALSVVDDTTSFLQKECIIERPKVIYNKKTKKFVMWFHHELKGLGYRAALTGVAVANNVTGPYKYIRSLRPNAWRWPVNYTDEQKKAVYPLKLQNTKVKEEKIEAVRHGMYLNRDFESGQMARDMTLFIDDDGKAYHIHSSEENFTLHVSELTDDYLGFTGKYSRVLPGDENEAPAICKVYGKYYLIASGCTGWWPNPARSAVADNIMGPYAPLGNPCRGTEEQCNTTFNSQSTYLLPVEGKKDKYILMLDSWRPDNAIDGRMVWLPLSFEDGKPVVRWHEKWNLSVFD
jgi:beta-xylosidase